MRASLKLLALTVAVAGLFGACDGGNSPSSTSGTGRLSVRMTDAPVDEVSSVNVYVTGLTIKPVDGPVQRIANDIGLIDLLTLQGTTLELVNLGVPAADYEFVMLELDQDQSNVVLLEGGEVVPLQIASEEVKVLGGFHVPDGGEAIVVFDFDAGASLRHLGNGDWLLVPVILMVSATSS
jgi:hypothetical protein